MAIIVATAFVFIPQVETAHADMVLPIKYDSKMLLMKGDYVYLLDMGKKAKNKHKKTVKSSKKSVLDTEVLEDGAILLYPEKAGKAKLTIKNKSTKKTYKCQVRVVKQQNPFKTFKVGKMNCAKDYNDYSFAFPAKDLTKGKQYKVNIKAKKGWKLKKITYVTQKEGSKKVHKKTIKNKGKITAKSSKWSQELVVKMYSKKYNMSKDFYLFIR